MIRQCLSFAKMQTLTNVNPLSPFLIGAHLLVCVAHSWDVMGSDLARKFGLLRRRTTPKVAPFLGSWLFNKRGFAEKRCSNASPSRRLKKAWREEEQNSASHHSELTLPHLLVGGSSLSPRDAHDSPPPLPTGLWELPSKEGQDKALPGQTLVFSISRPPPDHVK